MAAMFIWAAPTEPASRELYIAPAWLPGGHVQTIYTSLFITVLPANYRRERLELDDGDFLDFDWIDGNANAPVVVLFHGLEGSSASYYAQDCRAFSRLLG
ncbi:MAG: hypothetical protein DID92_2727744099 [Candidatus Nitrotoga sp. SPKER]|nr:MAG: hypothetical protein DID92_2727744099 [Candidatus Nitrotoga sp. SPKER]